MFRPIFAAILCAATIPALAQDGPAATGIAVFSPGGAAPTTKPKPTGRIIGTVTCADTHRPARGATVILISAQPGEGLGNTMARTGLDGAFLLPHVPAGEYALIAFFPGYAIPLSDESMSGMIGSGDKTGALAALVRQLGPVTVAPNGDAHTDITLTRGASLSGRILYSDGSPAAQVSIEVQNTAARPKVIHSAEDMVDPAVMMRTFFGHQPTSTDDQGRFRIAGLSPGTYRVAAIESSASSFGAGADDEGGAILGAMLGVNLDRSAIRVYAGDTLHQSAAKTYDLRSGDEVNDIAITIPLNAFHKLSGTVQAVDGRPLNIAELTLTDTTDPAFTVHIKAAGDGTFTFPAVPSGAYTLETANARIGVRTPAKGMESAPEQYWPLVPKFAFADAKQSILIKDSDLTDTLVSLKEIPLPKDEPSLSPEDTAPTPVE